MNFSKLRHRIVFLKPLDKKLNGMNENVPVWIPFKPGVNGNIKIKESEVYITSDYAGNAVIRTIAGVPYAHPLSFKDYAVWASVAPTTGREYDEAQKLREETTYKVVTRYFSDITSDMKILFRNRVLDIVSVLNINERNEELQLVVKEKDRNGMGER